VNFQRSLKTTRYKNIFEILFRTVTLQHRSTLLCLNVVKFVRREIDEIVRYLVDQKRISVSSQIVATARIAPKICQGQTPTMYSQCSRFHPNLFTLGGVIAERVNTVFCPFEIARTAVEISQFFDFSIWRPPPSWIFEISNF